MKVLKTIGSSTANIITVIPFRDFFLIITNLVVQASYESFQCRLVAN